MWQGKKATYPWLTLNGDGGLLCLTCKTRGEVKNASKGVYLRSEWTKEGVFCSGDTKAKQLTSLRNKIKLHKDSVSHIEAVSVTEMAKKDILGEAFVKQKAKLNQSTARLMRTAYSIAKNNRPYVSYAEQCELQEANGLDLGKGLHSRASATLMVDSIAVQMKATLCKTIISNCQKISIMLDESTTISQKSCLVLYIRTAFEQSSDCFAFPLELVELDSLTAEHITEKVLFTLHAHGFSQTFLSSCLIGACSDGASVMLGRNSGVLTRLATLFPNIFLWHCLCHRIELAIGDAVKSCKQINHVKSMLDKLYSVYSQSPKAQRELEDCATSLGVQLQKIGRVLDVKWAASSFKTLQAVWKSYAVLFEHFSISSSAQGGKHKAVYTGLKANLQSYEFVHSLAVMLDALEEVSYLSSALQDKSCSLSKVFQLTKRTIRALKNQKEGSGLRFKEYDDACTEESFKNVPLVHKGSFLNKNAFLQALIDNLTNRLYTNVSGTDINKLLEEFDVVDSAKWPSSIQSPWAEGEAKVSMMCQKYGLEFSECKLAFRDYIDDPSFVPPTIVKLKAILNTLPISSADCERGFSSMNIICNDLRNRLTISHISNLMFISLVGPPVSKFRPEVYVKKWLKTHRSADDSRTRISVVQHNERYSKLWKLF